MSSSPQPLSTSIQFIDKEANEDNGQLEKNGSKEAEARFLPSSDEETVTCAADIVGQWGPYHNQILISFIVVYFVAGFQNLGITFYTETPDHWCKNRDDFQVS